MNNMMNATFLILFILALSIIIQATAAIMAFKLVGITGRRSAWILIAVALAFMAIRRVVPFCRLIIGDLSLPPDPLNEVIGLALSITMAAGIARIAPLFIERKQAEEALHLQAVELEKEVAERQMAQEDLQEKALLLEDEIKKRQMAQDAVEKLNKELEQRVQERTAELEEKNKELQKTIRTFVGRELRMVELKERVKELEKKGGGI
jgi:hypothetical protein